MLVERCSSEQSAQDALASGGLPTGPTLLQAAQRMSDEVFDRFVTPLLAERGAPRLAAAALGALAGHACQLATIQGIAAGDPHYRGLSLVTVGGDSGDRYLMGDAVNRPVCGWRYSVWALVANATNNLDAPVPDLADLTRHVVSAGGGDTFGIPRDLPDDAPSPRHWLASWPAFEALAAEVPHPDYVPVAFALAFPRLVRSDAVDTVSEVTVMARIMMESTIAMSKLQANPASARRHVPAIH